MKQKSRTGRAPRGRRRGQRAITEHGQIDRRLIISCALDLAKSTPLAELSIVRVARELGVTPALIHYYLEGRDALTSGVMNAFYGGMLADWPAASGRWREDVEAVARHVYEAHVRYPGIAAYVISHNRFRMAQLVAEGEADHGIELFDRFVAPFRGLGFDAHRTAMWAHLVMEMVISNAYATVRHRWPGEHGEFLRRILGRLDPERFPNACFVREANVRLNAGEAFSLGLELMLEALQREFGAAAGRAGGRVAASGPRARRPRRSSAARD
ncbi:MAG: TetR/AcrR family transcriptional regulator C-terminal domain-containing protein [Steroidobacteraceae bacterium]